MLISNFFGRQCRNFSEQSKFIQSLKYPSLDTISYLHYIHIGKTAGRSIKKFFDFVELSFPVSPPFKFVSHGHNFTIQSLPTHSKAVVSIRDPIHRFVSAFESRKYKLLTKKTRYKEDSWVYSLFPSVESLVDSLFSDPRAIQATRVIPHIRQPYSHFFPIKYLDSLENNIFSVISQESLITDISTLASMTGFSSIPHVADYVGSLAENSNRRFTQVSTTEIVTNLSTSALSKVKAFLCEDYIIYNRLLDLKHTLVG